MGNRGFGGGTRGFGGVTRGFGGVTRGSGGGTEILVRFECVSEKMVIE